MPDSDTASTEAALPLPSAGAVAVRRSVGSLYAGLAVFHLLSLDAVAVALTWQNFLGVIFSSPPTAVERWALGLTVAMVYLMDRQLDARRLIHGVAMTPRHFGHHQYRRWLLPVLFVLGVAMVFVVVRLERSLMIAGAAMAATTAAYLLVVHTMPRRLGRGAKELCVGIVFAAGCATHILGGPSFWVLWAAVAAVAALFTLNCLMISAWEFDEDRAQGFSALPGGRWLTNAAVTLAILGVGIGAFLALRGETVFAVLAGCVALSAALLAMLNRVSATAPPLILRVAADLVLLTPLLALRIAH